MRRNRLCCASALLTLFWLATAACPAAAASVSTAASVTVPKWLAKPALDGKCTDPSYEDAAAVALVDSSGLPGAPVKLLHSGLDLYLCLQALPGGDGLQIAVRVDSDGDGTAIVEPGDYELIVRSDGTRAVRQGATSTGKAGGYVPIAVSEQDFDARVLSEDDRGWSAELRISLEWLGGYGRTDGLSVALEKPDGTAVQQWPAGARADSPTSWGRAALGPLYSEAARSGSAFLDGREGYLVVPFAPELNHAEMTVEAWVRVVGNDCGTLVGNGQAGAYWLALCNVIRFGHGGRGTVRSGQHPLGEGWHHVAVSVARGGQRILYLDGEVDVSLGWSPEAEPVRDCDQPAARLGRSDRMLRIGSDRDALNRDGEAALHGYVRELRIWNRARTQEEIRADAFRDLTGREPGLVGLWPFRNNLNDLSPGRHHAGLIGSAALARETRDVEAFAEKSRGPAIPYPKRQPVPAWDGRIPVGDAAVEVNGICALEEYARAAELRLEPGRTAMLRAFVGRDALYLCTNVLWGQKGTGSLTVWLNGAGNGGGAPGSADLRLRLAADGTFEAGTGDGKGFGGRVPEGIVARTVTAPAFAFQEDIKPVQSPWWSGELRVPLAALAPFAGGDKLQMAVLYEGTYSPAGTPAESLRESWPASFEPDRPSTWGWVATGALAAPAKTAPKVQRAAGKPRSRAAAAKEPPTLNAEEPTAAAKDSGPDAWPRQPPTQADFYAQCPDSGPIQAFYAFDSNFKWPRVDPANHPIVQAEGTLTEVELSTIDSPLIHSSHDLDLFLSIAQPFRWLTVDGIDSLVLESESGFFIHQARPDVGDHVTVKGRWIFDCGHAPKTEIHPTPYFESDRVEMRPTGLGGELEPVRVAKVWMTSAPGAFGFNLNALAPFEFDLALPDNGYSDGLPFLRVVQGPAAFVAATLEGSLAHVTVTPPAEVGGFYFELMLGTLDEATHACPPSCYWYGVQDVFNVTFDQIVIHDDHDDWFFRGDGDWFMDVNVNGVWKPVFTNGKVDDDYSPYILFPPVTATVVGGGLSVEVTAYESDSADAFTVWEDDEALTSGTWDAGFLPDMAGNTHWLSPGAGADWELHYSVTQGGSVEPMLNDAPFWSARLADEPDDPYHPVHLGTLAVPPEGAPALSTQHPSFVTEPPLSHSGVRMLGTDVDEYVFKLADFANVSFGPAGGLAVDAIGSYSNYYDKPPQPILDMLGYTAYTVKVSSTTGLAGDKAYTLKVDRTWRTLPPDPGENQDVLNQLSQGGRLVDLVTPNPETDVYIDKYFGLDVENRELEMPWAWQHVTGDIDYYDVRIPPAKERPPGQPVCEFEGGTLDIDAYLEIQAQGMRVRVPAKSINQENLVGLGDLNSKFPFGHVFAWVQSIAGNRGAYHLDARWHDGAYLDEAQCAYAIAMILMHRRVSGLKAIDWRSVYIPQLDLPRPPEIAQVDIYELGGFQVIEMGQAGILDSVVSSGLEQPVGVRLLDNEGVLLGESLAFSEGKLGARIPPGLLPQGRLQVEGLDAGTYLLQIVPLFDIGAMGSQQLTVGTSIAAGGGAP
jgi:Concanavalin A-like lectin/glucanases superfamily